VSLQWETAPSSCLEATAWNGPADDERALADGARFLLPAGGLFTTTSPELRRVKPENVGDRVCVKLTYVVLEAQYQSALTKAVQRINARNPKVSQCVCVCQHGACGVSIWCSCCSCAYTTPSAGVL
jgi:hypothetical protein